jgi:hypothetical protein
MCLRIRLLYVNTEYKLRVCRRIHGLYVPRLTNSYVKPRIINNTIYNVIFV